MTVLSQAVCGQQPVKVVYLDLGSSASSRRRPALEHLLGDIRNDPPDYLIVSSLDRLTRSISDHLAIREQLMAANVLLVLASGTLDHTELGIFAAVVDTVARHYHRKLAGRTSTPDLRSLETEAA